MITGTGGPSGTAEAGSPAPGVTGMTGPEPAMEQQVLFSFTRNLLGDPQAADELAGLFKALYQALDERQVTYGQGTLQLVVAADVADDLAEKLTALGVSATIKRV